MSRLGYYYEKGIGCNVDLEKALVLYQVAANNGIVEARRRLNQYVTCLFLKLVYSDKIEKKV